MREEFIKPGTLKLSGTTPATTTTPHGDWDSAATV
jgi:hypothetical protein